MKELSDEQIEKIIDILKKGVSLPEDYRLDLLKYLEQTKNSILFDTKKEYELVYADKEREEDILAETMAVPLQKVKTFRNGKNLKNADGTPGARLVYIDPPFATRQEFRGSQEQKAYQDKIAGARFLEFLRKRLVLLREILSEDGFVFVHLDWKKAHYVKGILDEIFQEINFRNEIIVPRPFTKNLQQQFNETKTLNVRHDTLLFYSKKPETTFPLLWIDKSEVKHPEGHWHHFWSNADRPTMRYELFGITPTTGQWIWEEKKAKEAVENYKRYLKEANGRTLLQYWLDTGKKYRFIRQDEEGKPQSWRPPATQQLSDTLWLNVMSYENRKIYPTQKHEQLLDRIINSFSSHGDLVLDCFAGSGTTLAVAEKLGRRWISVDCGKLAIYTMQKRLLNIAESKETTNPKKKYGKPCKPFTLYNAGLYDYKMIKELPWEQYRDFALKLFQCRNENHKISKVELDGYLGADSVLVFNYQKYKEAMMDRDFIDDLHKYLGDKIGRRFFIIAPAASVQFLEDYIEKGKTKYFILRIPYSIIEEIHNRGFTKIKQPVSEMDVNDTVDAVGFDFIQVPTVDCKYYMDKPKNPNLLNQKTKECVIKIEKFMSKVISRKHLEFANRETLSMVMLDYDFDGEVFDLDEVFYAEDLKKNNHEVRFAEDKVKGQMMIIYIDIFGNEKREIKSIKDFTGKR
jgi:site-specific DNA-methyltransferase (adenine-specific)/adenine-specific DNA-methyltransferase